MMFGIAARGDRIPAQRKYALAYVLQRSRGLELQEFSETPHSGDSD